MTASGSDRGTTGRGGQPGSPEIPASIGRYQIQRLLGRGGQGDVYLARHPSLDIDVAIKVLHPEYRTEEFIERFSNEARIAARLDVRNIVRVYDFDPEYPYLVMEYCGDGDLSRYIKSRRRRPLPEMLGIVRQVLEALVAAHENAPPILHRDLKPSNVLFSRGVPKVADFGLAKALGGGSGLTTTRGMMGTIRYCSPEQIKDASAADARTDLWSMGIILYELLAWRRPFDKPGDSDSNVMFKVHMEPPQAPPYEIPAPMMAVIGHALEKDREKRFASARQMMQAMDDALRRIPGADTMLLPPESMLDELSRMASEISTLIEKGDSEAAESVLKSLRKKAPDDSVGRFWRDRLKEVREKERSKSGSSAPVSVRKETSWVEERLASVESLIGRRDYREARRVLGEILYKAPDNTDAHRWLERITEEERRLREDLEGGRRDAEAARAARDYARVVAVWKTLDERYPGMPDVQSELAVASREKTVFEQIRSRDETARAARRHQDGGDLREAVAAWARHLGRFPDDEEALQAHEELAAALAAHEKAERLAGLKGAAMQRRQAGDLAGALALWEGYLLEDPAWEEAAREAAELRRIVAERERTALLDQTRAKTAARLAAGDPRGALREWELVQRALPGEKEAADQIRRLTQELAALEVRALASEVERLAAELRSRVDSGRYASLAGPAAAALPQALEAARAALAPPAGAADLARARERLAAARDGAEATLAAELRKKRLDLQRGVALNRDWVSGGAATAEERRLAEGIDGAMAALCAARADAAPGDPLEPLIAAQRRLEEAAGSLTGARKKSIQEAQAAAAKSLKAADVALQALVEVAGAEGSGPGSAISLLRERLESLREEAGSSVPDRLAAVVRQAGTFVEEVRSERVLALHETVREMGALVREARSHLIYLPDDKLEKLVRETARLVEPDGPSGGGAVEPQALSRLRDGLRRELEITRRALNERIAKAEERWRKAEKGWRETLAANLGASPKEKAEQLITGGQQALTALRAEELESWAGQLEGLIRRCRLEAAWIEQSDAVMEVEGALGSDGLPSSELPVETVELLARFRTAAARGDAEQVRALSAGIEKRRAHPGRAGAPEAAGPPVAVPELSAAARRFNERYNAAMLKAFDELLAKHKAATAGRRSGEAARLAAELVRAHRRLVQPPPAWKRALMPLAVLIAAIVVTVAAIGPGVATTTRYQVKVISPSGEITVESLTKDGARVAGIETRIDEAGATWTLEPGRYVVTAGGASRQFEVPGDSGILLAGGAGRSLPAVRRYLDMSGGAAP